MKKIILIGIGIIVCGLIGFGILLYNIGKDITYLHGCPYGRD